MIPRPHLLLTALLLTTFAAHSQVKEGRIVYQRKINIHRRLTNESMKSMVPEFDSAKTELLFTSDESLYRNIKEAEDIRDQAGQDNDHPMIRMKFGGGDDQTYKNYTQEIMTEQREMGPKKYIVEDSFPHNSWKLEPETRTIDGYLCKKATTKGKSGNAVVVWYTEDIQSPAGPEYFGGLPGLILLLDSNEGELIITAMKIDTAIDKKLVQAPTDGKKITQAAFRKMMEDQFGAGGGKGTIRIIRN